MAIHYKTEGYARIVSPANKKDFTLKELQDFVGGPIQIVPLPSGARLVAHENGKNIGLAINHKASEIWRKEYPIEEYEINNDQVIVGDVLIATPEEVGEDNE